MITAIVGGLWSVLLMMHAGRYDMPPFLVVLIGMWVLLPFDAFIVGNVLSPRWSNLVSVTLYRLTFLITLVSVAIYASIAFGPSRSKPAFFFVLLPPLSLALIAIATFIAWKRSRNDTR